MPRIGEMKVLLIYPSLLRADIRHYTKAVERHRGIYACLGLSYVASSLLHRGHQVAYIDCDAEDNPWKSIETTVREFQPDLVGFHTMTWTFAQANELLMMIKEIRPDIKSVAGGPNITSFPSFALEISEFDLGVHGEGEITITELVDALENGHNLNKIAGISFKAGGEVIVNPPRTFIADLDQVPFPAWDMLAFSRYFDAFTRHNRFATMMATRGCPFNCTYCDRLNRMGRKWRARSPQNVVEEIKFLISSFGIKEVMFFDDNLIVDHNWIYSLCEEISRQKVEVDWECRARVDMVDRPLLQAMKKAGCYRIRYGMESGDDYILEVLKKGIAVEQSLECARISKEAGIEIFAYFMMGSPYETTETLDRTLELALKVDGDFAVFSKTILIVGSELFDWAVENGYIHRDYWKNFLLGKETNPAPALSTKDLPEGVVDKYISRANGKFYLRPRYVARRLRSIRSPGQLYRQFQMARGVFSSG